MFKKVVEDFNRGSDFYEISDDFDSPKLGEYYLLFDEDVVRSRKVQSLIADYDENGIPLNRPYIDVSSDGLVYYPITIGQVGLSIFHSFLKTQSDNDLKRFLHFADWFVENGDETNNLGIRWLTDIPLPAYQNPGPWQSAFSQSRAISILLRAFQHTQETGYLETAQKALVSFTIPVSKGGVMSQTEWGPFFEEYPADVPVLVLNGHIFSLFGLFDYTRVFPKDSRCKSLVNDGINSLLLSLSSFDMGYWSRYNFCKAEFYPKTDPATISYHRLHIILLKVVNQFKENSILTEYIKKWENYIGILNFVKASYWKYKALQKLNRI
jgi:hypothetical protein